MSGLDGRRVALLEGRMSGEMAALVRRQGGEPYAVPAVRETALAAGDQVAQFIEALIGGSIEVAVFMTGAGVRALFREADLLGRKPELQAALQRVITVCRGPKPSSALGREDVQVSLAAAEPYTMTEVLAAMESLDLCGTGLALVHYGEREGGLSETLRERGASLTELCLYEWLLPEDLSPLQALIGDIIAGRVDAVAFTSQVQARHLFAVAAGLGKGAELTAALNTKLVVASLGPTCANALRGLGVEPHVVPEHSKMGHLIVALGQYLSGSTHAE